MTDDPITFVVGSGNVFADLGFANPDLELAKADLLLRIDHQITSRKLTHAQAAVVLKLDKPKLSDLLRGRGRYSFDRLFRFLTALGQNVEITVRPAEKGGPPAETRVVRG